ncbi:MAG: CoA-binding protein [Candidatus Woesearchaeota archaeon]
MLSGSSFVPKQPYAIIGATNNKEKYGNIIMKDLLSKGISIIPINPKHKSIMGIKCYPTLASASIKNNIGLIIIVIPPNKALDIIVEASIIGIKELWLQPGSESEEAIKLCEKHNIKCTMNACIMTKT